MLPITHFLVGLLFGLIGVRIGFFGYFGAFLIAILAVLIDFDHLITYYVRHKEWNLKRCWNVSLGVEENLWTFLHYWKGFFVILIFLIILGIFNLGWGYFLFSIYVPHFLLDQLHLYWVLNKGYKIHKIFGMNVIVYILEILLVLIVLGLILWLVYLKPKSI